jgi:hypothetical protein
VALLDKSKVSLGEDGGLARSGGGNDDEAGLIVLDHRKLFGREFHSAASSSAGA